VTLAGVAATRLFAAAGAGGVALTVWAMRAAGIPAARVVVRMSAFMVVLYGIFMCALVVGGTALALGAAPVDVPHGLSVVPAAFGLFVIVSALTLSRLRTSPRTRGTPRDGRVTTIRRRVSHGARLLAAGVRDALVVARSDNVGLLAAIAWWGFDVAVLWAAFRAFGDAPAVAVLVTGYFVGMLANTLPLPGGVGGVEVGMVGAFVGLGVDPGLAVVAVLSYRAIAFWLPTAPGAFAYVRLRHDVARWRAHDGSRRLATESGRDQP
jgi:uncharacterized membrane protein YbhN (UPF0104 family)